MATLILTALGDDRPGLVSVLSAPISSHGASWERSQMSRLAGKFAGIVVVEVADDRYQALVADLTALGDHGLQVTVERTDEPAGPSAQRLLLELLGDDHPGIVAEVSACLAAQHVSIEDLVTGVRDAPMAGGTLFEARAVLSAPVSVSAEDLRSELEGLAGELMVELSLSDE